MAAGNHTYEVTELQKYNEMYDNNDAMMDDGQLISKTGKTAEHRFWTSSRMNCLFLTLLMIILFLLVAILAMQVLQQINNDNVVHCSNDEGATSSVLSPTGTSQAATTFTCNCTTDTTLLERLENTWNKTILESDLTCQNSTETLGTNLETTQEALEKLYGIVSTLSHLEENSKTTEGVVNDILLKVEELLSLHNDTQATEPKSCKDIIKNQPYSPNGYYNIDGQSVYCEMGVLCGTEGGWTRLAYLDMTDSTVECPEGFKLYQSGNVRACGRLSGQGNCVSVKFPSDGIGYSEVCGRVVGYQYGSPDAFDIPVPHSTMLDSYYLDGISITRGNPRKHIWSLAAGIFESKPYDYNCPCNSPTPGDAPPDFVGSDYFCESGIPGQGSWYHQLYTADPLWDGKGCGAHETACCAAAGLPWFHKTFNTSTTDYLELRVCGADPYDNTPVSLYEIYVR